MDCSAQLVNYMHMWTFCVLHNLACCAVLFACPQTRASVRHAKKHVGMGTARAHDVPKNLGTALHTRKNQGHGHARCRAVRSVPVRTAREAMSGWFNKDFDVNRLKPFGCIVYPHIPHQRLPKGAKLHVHLARMAYSHCCCASLKWQTHLRTFGTRNWTSGIVR